ncbi:MAG: SulP family inorganic anion transporter [Phocaeicola sp.]
MDLSIFQPKLLSTLKHYNKELLASDVMAGITVGIVALPLAIAFGIASGVSPEKGIITAVIAGFIVSLLGGSRVQIGGPTGSFIVIMSGVIQGYGINGLTIVTLMAGAILIILGVCRLGTVIKFIPYPIIVGFTSGIAITIFSTQIADFLGLDLAGEKIPIHFIEKWSFYGAHLHTTHLWNLSIGVISILMILATPKFSKRVPGPLIAIIVATIAAYLLKTYGGITGIDTIGDRFSIQASLPEATMPSVSWNTIQELLPVGLTIAILGAIESLISATVADGTIGDHHDSNTELIAQGVANVVTPFFGGIPATGAIARTMTNINNGGKTPIAGIVHAAVLLLILLFLMPLAQYIPMACLAGILVVVSYNMSEWRSFKSLLKSPTSDVCVLCITFFLTVIFDLTIAIEVGLLMACILFMKRVMETTHITVLGNEATKRPIYPEKKGAKEETFIIPKEIELYEISGPYFFGVANKFDEVMLQLGQRPQVRIIRMRNVPFIDATGIHNLTNLVKKNKKEQIQIILSGVNQRVDSSLEKAGFYHLLHKEYRYTDIEGALNKAKQLVKREE